MGCFTSLLPLQLGLFVDLATVHPSACQKKKAGGVFVLLGFQLRFAFVGSAPCLCRFYTRSVLLLSTFKLSAPALL